MNISNLAQKIDFNNIEKAFSDFLEKPIWVASNVQKGKIPIDPKTGKIASCDNPHTWGTLTEVRDFIESNPGHFPAIALSKEHGLTCIDLDNVCHEEQKLTWAQDLYKASGSYCERSVSSNGLHIFVRGNKPGTKCKSGQTEIYDQNKFITVTGNTLPGHTEIKAAQEFIDKFYKDNFKEKDTSQINKQKSPPFKDSEVLSLCMKMEESSHFKRLYDEGDISEYDNDASTADFHLCRMITYFTQNKDQIFRIIKQSKLYTHRKGKDPRKWDRQDYREQTIENAINCHKNFYQTSNEEEGACTLDTGLCKEQPFPYQALPRAMQDAVIKIARDSDSDPAIPGTAAQALASIAIRRNVKVIEKTSPKLEHLLTFFHVVVGGSAQSRKSTTTNPLLDVFKKYHTEQKATYTKQMKEFENAKKAAEKAKKLICEDNLKPIAQKAEEMTAIDLALEEKKPLYYRLFSTDTTGPAFVMRLGETDGCYSIFTTDGGDIIDYIIGNNQTGTNDMIFVKLITNDAIHVDRVGPDRKGVDIEVPNPCGNVFIMTQEERWVRFNTHPRLQSSGLLGRNNPCIIAPRKIGYIEESIQEKEDTGKEAFKAWDDMINTLLNQKAPITLKLSAEAKEARRAFNNALQATVGVEQENYDVADIVHRCVSETVKRAALFHICDNYLNLNNIQNEIPLETYQRAVVMQKYYLQQAINARRGDFSKAEAMEITAFLKKWIEKCATKDKRFSEFMSCRDLSRFFHLPKDKLIKFLPPLEEAGIVNILASEGKRSAKYQLKPSRAKHFIGMS